MRLTSSAQLRHVESVPGVVVGKGLLAGQHGLRCRGSEDPDIVGVLGDEPLEVVVVVRVELALHSSFCGTHEHHLLRLREGAC
jgi:hypothetical protein